MGFDVAQRSCDAYVISDDEDTYVAQGRERLDAAQADHVFHAMERLFEFTNDFAKRDEISSVRLHEYSLQVDQS